MAPLTPEDLDWNDSEVEDLEVTAKAGKQLNNDDDEDFD
jgi:hypothetical protein